MFLPGPQKYVRPKKKKTDERVKLLIAELNELPKMPTFTAAKNYIP